MSVLLRPALAETMAQPDHVLLEQWVTFSGYQLELRVTTANAARPDTVAVNVRYGIGHAEVIVRAEGDKWSAGTDGSPLEAVGTLIQATTGHSATEYQTVTPLSSTQQQKTEARETGTPGPPVAHADIKSGRGNEEQDAAPLGEDGVNQTVHLVTERDEATSSTSGIERQSPLPLTVTPISEPVNPDEEYTNKLRLSAKHEQDVMTPAEGTLGDPTEMVVNNQEMCQPVGKQEPAIVLMSGPEDDTSCIVEHHSQLHGTSQETHDLRKRTILKKLSVQPRTGHPSVRLLKGHCDLKTSENLSTKLDRFWAQFSAGMQMPKKVFHHILSFLTWKQLQGVRRVSKSWLDAVDDCLAEFTELHIGSYDFPAVLDDVSLEKLLRPMPALKSLSVEWRLDREKLDIDIVSQCSQNLVEIDLTRFRTDTWSLQQLCVACPKLEVVKLPRKSDDSYVEVLLRSLPNLRSLDLAHTQVTGQFLTKSNESVEKLSLANCSKLKFENLRVVHPVFGDPLQQVICWKQLRELDLSSTMVSSPDVADLLRHFPQLEQLSFAHCSKIESACLLQVAYCERLCDLDISHVGDVQGTDLLRILTRCSQLERLVLAGCKVLGQPCLRQIDQTSVDLGLRELDVSEVRGLVVTDLIAILSRSPQLESLRASDFEKMELTACLTPLGKCTELRVLDMSRPGADLQRKCIDPVSLRSLLMGCQKLERLLLAGCHISESASLQQLAQCPKLRELDLSRATGLEAADLAHGLSGCPLLERLSVAGLPVPLEQLVPPTGLARLIYLDVSGSGLTSNSLRRLRGLFPRLQELSMLECKEVKKGSLVSYLPRLPHLRSLDLRSVPNVTQTLLKRLKGSHLGKLRLNKVNLQEDGEQLSANSVAELALECRSLKALWLEVSENVFKVIRDTVKKRRSSDRAFAICISKGTLSPREYRSLANVLSTSSQLGNVWTVEAATVNWDKV